MPSYFTVVTDISWPHAQGDIIANLAHTMGNRIAALSLVSAQMDGPPPARRILDREIETLTLLLQDVRLLAPSSDKASVADPSLVVAEALSLARHHPNLAQSAEPTIIVRARRIVMNDSAQFHSLVLALIKAAPQPDYPLIIDAENNILVLFYKSRVIYSFTSPPALS